MKYRLTSLILVFLTVVNFLTVSCSAAFETSNERITLRVVDYEDVLKAAKNNSVDSILYPSGMTLPTKYADLMFFASSYEEVAAVPTQIAQMLKLNWPTQDGRYTYAEVLTAELYYYTFSYPYYAVNDMDVVCRTLDSLANTQYVSNIFDYNHETYTAVLPDSTRFVPVLEEYANILRAPGMEEGNPYNSADFPKITTGDNIAGLPLSFDYEPNWNYIIQPDDPEDSDAIVMCERLSEFYSTRPDYWAYFGIDFLPTGVNLVDTEHLLIYNGLTPLVIQDEIVKPSELILLNGDLPFPTDGSGQEYFLNELAVPTKPRQPDPSEYLGTGITPVEVESTVEQPEISKPESQEPPPIYDPSEEKESSPATKAPNQYVQTSVDPMPEEAPIKERLGLADFFTILAVVVVLLGVIVLCILDYLRRRHDPTRSWKHR